MINISEQLTILHDDDGTFINESSFLSSYSRDTVDFDYNSSEDFVYIGFYKPINALYFDFKHANNQELQLKIEYFNGTEFTDLPNFVDDTRFMTRSGFVRWERNLENETTTTVNNLEKYWYRFDLIGAVHQFVVNGINIVFADDTDLKREYFEINQFLPNGQSSHILTHEAVRDEIVQHLNQQLSGKYNQNEKKYSNITAFDLLDIAQVKVAATYLALAKIFLSVSDEVDDLYMEKHKIYMQNYKNIIKTVQLNIDFDDDGIDDKLDRQPIWQGFIRKQ